MIALLATLTRFIRGIWYGLKDPEFKGLLYFVILLLTSGTIFYTTVEGWRPLDALYFSLTTLTTVGFGDLSPKTDMGKIFTILYILVGVGSLLGFLNLVAHHSQENDPIHRLLYKRNNKKDDEEEKP